MIRNNRIPMTYRPDGSRLWWRVYWERVLGPKGGIRHAWFFRDHDGYERFGGENWRELVLRFSAVAENYNMDHSLS